MQSKQASLEKYEMEAWSFEESAQFWSNGTVFVQEHYYAGSWTGATQNKSFLSREWTTKAEISYQQQALSSVWVPGMAYCWAAMTDPFSGQTFPIPAAPKTPATMKSHCCLPLLWRQSTSWLPTSQTAFKPTIHTEHTYRVYINHTATAETKLHSPSGQANTS